MANIAFILADGYEDSEFRRPFESVREHGHEPTVVGKDAGSEVAGKRGEDRQTVDKFPAQVSSNDFDALVIPGGKSPEALLSDDDTIDFVRQMVESGKPIAAICHGPLLLARAGVLRGRTLTSYPEIREVVEKAGAKWVDREVVEDGNLITSRKPDDLDAFCRTLLAQLG